MLNVQSREQPLPSRDCKGAAMALRATKLNEDAPQPRRVRASALPPGFCPARNFTSVRPSTHRIFKGAVNLA